MRCQKIRGENVRLSKGLVAGICVLLLGSVALSACGSQQPQQQPSATPKASPHASARQAAKRYFAAMAPVIAKDYKGYKQAKVAMKQWDEKYGNGVAPSWAAVQALAQVVMGVVPLERRIVAEYGAIKPPRAFRAAHRALLADNRAGLTWGDEFIHDVLTQRPPGQWVSRLGRKLDRGTILEKRVLREYRKAAARVRLRLPAKLVKVYSD
jgi:hypothetical protein